MNLKTFASLAKGGKVLVLLRLKFLFTSFYRLNFLASMENTVILERLARSPVTAESLSAESGDAPSLRRAAEAWLGLGVRLGVLKRHGGGYSLRGFLAKRLAAPGNEAIHALVREVASLHHLYIMQTPAKLVQGNVWDPSDPYGGYGGLIARSSRTLEPFLFELINRVFPRSGPVRLLEVGCGQAGYILYALGRNRESYAVGLEIDPQVAESARGAVRAGGLGDRVTIMVRDVREYRADEPFDILTLYNNIYYFPVEERVELLRHLKGLLRPNGRIVLTTGCMNGSIEFELVNLIHASTRGWGRLPDRDEMLRQMSEAGFERNSATDLMPGNKYYAFTGFRSGK
jgi:4-hydroxy-2,2'-bipyrrole-5-carbaldehyde O-methyltransferase